MKHSPSDSPPSSPLLTPKSEGRDSEYNPSDSSPSPTKKARATPKKARQPSQPGSSAKKDTPRTDWEAGWTPDKKEAIVEKLISIGIKGIGLGELCQEAQLGNQLQAGHKNNLRDKAAKGVRQ